MHNADKFKYGATFWQGLDDDGEPIEIVIVNGGEKHIVARRPARYGNRLVMEYEVADAP